MSRVCLLFCRLLELVEEIRIFLAAGESMAHCKAAAVPLRACGVGRERSRASAGITAAAHPAPRGSPLLSSNKNLSSGVFHSSTEVNEISLASEMQRNGTQLSLGRSEIAA